MTAQLQRVCAAHRLVVLLISLLYLARPVLATPAASIPVGALPAGIALNPSTGLLYVSNEGDGTVSMIAATGASGSVVGTVSLIGTVALGGSPAPVGIGIDAASNLVFVAEGGAQRVAILDGSTALPRGTVAVDPAPWGVAVNQRTNTVYVSCLDGSVAVLDGSSGALRTIVRDPRLQRPAGVAVNEATNQVYVANLAGNSVAVLDGSSNAVTTTFAAGSGPAAVAVDVRSGAVYVANSGGTSLTRLDPASGTSATLEVGAGPLALAVDPTNGVVYAALADGVVALDATGNRLGTLSDPDLRRPQAIAVGNGAVYALSGDGSVVVLVPLQPAAAAGGQGTAEG